MVEIVQLTVRGQLPSKDTTREDELLGAVTTQSQPAFIHSNKRLGVRERGAGCFQLFAVEGSGNDTEILMEGVTLCPEGGKVAVHEMDGEIILDVGNRGKELSLVFKGRDANQLLLEVAKLLHERLTANPTMEGVSNYLQSVSNK